MRSFVNPNSQVSYIFRLQITRDFRLSGEIPFPFTAESREYTASGPLRTMKFFV
jgi:hypothetical protein